MVTRVGEDFVEVEGARTLGEKLADVLNAEDYGATIGGAAGTNTTAINAAIVAATATSGFVIVKPGTAYTEGSLVMADGVTVLIFDTSGNIIHLVKDQGTALPVTEGCVIYKSQANTGIGIRSLDYGVSSEPILQLLNQLTGQVAAMEAKFAEMREITDPTAPSANKVRLYCRDNGAGKTQLVARFPTGAIQQVAIEP